MSDRPISFFAQRREWSTRKHEVFEGYATQFSRILGRDHGTVFLVDGFAGEGSYGSGPDMEPGSPLIAARIAAQLSDKGHYKLRCINVESDREAYASLAASTAPFTEFVENRVGEFGEHVDEILKQIGTRPALFFLDPFGPGSLDWATLAKVGRRARSSKTELLINFNSPKFDRHAGWLDSIGQPPRDAFLDLLDRIIGSNAWIEVFQRPLPHDQRYEAISNFYLSRICEAFSFGGASYPIRTVSNEQLKYHLLFTTRHPLALRIMSSIFYGVEKRYLQERTKYVTAARGGQLELFARTTTAEELEEELLGQLRSDVLEVGRKHGRIKFARL